MPSTKTRAELPYRIRRSKVHGRGVFATRPIAKGARVIEYTGERISHAEADRRYETKAPNDNHTFLFTVDDKIVIDAGVHGNAARFINHGCDPNCETRIEDGRVFVFAIADISAGDELKYDYMIGRSPNDPPNIDKIFACVCGAATCRGTMLVPKKKPGRRPKPKKAAARKAKRSTRVAARRP
jgi:SET domain-containing protein